MKKNILAIGIISLFIGIAVLPICSASTPSSVLSTSKEDSQKPLGGERKFFVKAQVEGTVTGFHQGFTGGKHILPIRIFGWSPHVTITPAYYGEPVTFELDPAWSFTARFAKWETVEEIDFNTYYIKGTVYFCSIGKVPI